MSEILRWNIRASLQIPIDILNNKKYLPENNYFGILQEDKIPYKNGGWK